MKELRLAGISTIEAANAFLPSFVANYNGRFAKLPARDKDLHRLLDPRQDLDQVLCWREQRQVSHQLVVNYSRMKLTLKPEGIAVRLRGKMVDICDFPDGGWRFDGKAGRCFTPPSTSCSASVMPPSSRTSVSERFWPGSRNSKTASHVKIPDGPRRSSQKPGILKNRALQIAEAAKSKSKAPPARPAPLRYGGLRGAGSRSQRCRRVTFQLCTNSDISTWLQQNRKPILSTSSVFI